MMADGPAQELATGAILELCDKVLGEVGRRSHRFSWLRAPGGGADAWLPVDAYYPRHRLVVLCHRERAPYDHLIAQLVPEHGLRLLELSPVELGGDPAIAEPVLRRMIARLPEPPSREPAEEARPRPSRLPQASRLSSLSLPSLPRPERRRRPESERRADERPRRGRPRPWPGPRFIPWTPPPATPTSSSSGW